MENLGIEYSEKFQHQVPWIDVKFFLQAQINRLIQGAARYGWPAKKKKYMTRLSMELEAYIKTGNAEHLFNIANYALLEAYSPEHKKHNYNNSVDSVTRGKI